MNPPTVAGEVRVSSDEDITRSCRKAQPKAYEHAINITGTQDRDRRAGRLERISIRQNRKPVHREPHRRYGGGIWDDDSAQFSKSAQFVGAFVAVMLWSPGAESRAVIRVRIERARGGHLHGWDARNRRLPPLRVEDEQIATARCSKQRGRARLRRQRPRGVASVAGTAAKCCLVVAKVLAVDIHRMARTVPTRWIMAAKLASVFS